MKSSSIKMDLLSALIRIYVSSTNHEAAHLGRNPFFNVHVINRDATNWGTWYRALYSKMKQSKIKEDWKEKRHLPGRFWTHDLVTGRPALLPLCYLLMELISFLTFICFWFGALDWLGSRGHLSVTAPEPGLKQISFRYLKNYFLWKQDKHLETLHREQLCENYIEVV